MHCMSCGKHFKNKASLKTHKYRYHPYSKNVKLDLDSKSQDSDSDEGSSVDKDHDQIRNNKIDVQLLSDDLERLRKLVYSLDVKMMGLEHTKNMVSDSKITDDSNYKEDLKTVNDRSMTNKDKLSAIEKKLGDLIESTKDKNNIVVEDLIHDVTEVKDMFMNSQYEEILSDIPKLRLVANFLITAMKEIDIGVQSDENIELLEEIGQSSKAKIRNLVKEKFNELVGIFTKLNIDEFYEKTDGNDSDSSKNSDDEPDGEPYDEYPDNVNSDHSESSDSESSDSEGSGGESSDSDHSNTAEQSGNSE